MVIQGQIKNVYSKRDETLLFISVSELSSAIGRNAMFESQMGGGCSNRLNLAGDDVRKYSGLQAVAANTDTVFNLKNYDVLTLDCQDHDSNDIEIDPNVDDQDNLVNRGKKLDYRTNMQLIFQFIEFRL